jgi:XTP/dITP diphosphohydrolase
LIFATRNRGKLVELRQLLPEFSVLSIDEFENTHGRPVPTVSEDGATFLANAEKKAIEVSRATGLPALADDSGLEVDALGGAPGVHSARYAGEHCSDDDNNRKLLAAMTGVDEAKRTARFRAVLALADVTGALGAGTLSAEGTCEGVILTSPRGAGGFGYDPLFFLPALGQTFAELGVGTKNHLSHRAQAMHALVPRLRAYLAALTHPVA